jgi:hypothetical protein
MRVFCPEHKRGFFAPRQSPIKCENRSHMLGELDFEGQAKPPVEMQWQYCCNCEHFCPIDFDQDGLERCPVCTRRSSMLFVCDRCYTISFESNTPLQTKNFTLTSEGAPQPSCPGCLQATSTDLREHICDALGASFVTALKVCPICQERLDIGPSFPSSVERFLKRTKAANKLNVTFDYDTELFVPVEDGEFVLITNGNEAFQPIVLPVSARFEKGREFYEFYQDYYHCAKPDAGEVHIIEPATVAPAGVGWKFHAPGTLEVLENQPKKKAAADATRRQMATPVCAEPKLSLTARKEQELTTACTNCGSAVETSYAFCWECGNSLTPKNEPSIARSGGIIPWAASATEDGEQTVQHEVRPVSGPMFSWALPNEAEQPNSGNTALPKLIAIVVVGLLMVSVGLFALTHSGARMTAVTAAQPVTADDQSIPSLAPTTQVTTDVPTEDPPQRNSAPSAADEELDKVRGRRIAATASDRLAIIQTIARAEKQYPNDYRFPYERAKVAIIGSQSSSHDEAFSALSLAAEKAISSGKTHEMLESLEADKSGDFHKLSHGHRQWNQVAAALKNTHTGLQSAKVKF